MRHRTTKIESLSAKHPGLEKDVCRWLKSHLTGAEVAKRLRAKYRETVAPNTVSSYRVRRLDHMWKSVEDQKISYLAFMEAVGEEGLDAGAAAKLWEALQSMTPAELIAVRRLQVDRKRVEILDKRANVDAQRAENATQKLKATLAQLKGEGKRTKGGKWGLRSEKPVSARELRREIREMYGLPDDSAEIEDHPVSREEAVKEMADAIYGIGKYAAEPDESESNENKSDAQGPKSDDPNGPGPPFDSAQGR
jgi:hypothetical protein